MRETLWVPVVAVLGPLIGSAVGVLLPSRESLLHRLLAFAAGTMLTLSFLELIPESLSACSPPACAAGLAVGVFGVLALHRNDPLVRCGESARKERYKSPEKGSEVTQYLLVDGVIRGAVMGHFRYGPYDLHAVWLELPEQEAAVRRDEILRAVYAVNGPREEPPPFVPVG